MTNELTGSGMERLTQNPERQIGKVNSKKDFGDAIPDFPTKDSNEIISNKDLSSAEKNDHTLIDKKDLQENKNSEIIENGIIYEIDDQGRTIKASGRLTLSDGPRKSLNANNIGGKDKRETDHRGHIIADILGGSNTKENLVAQDSVLNQGPYKALENDMKKQLKAGKKVDVTVELVFEGDSERPSEFIHTAVVDGDTSVTTFLNENTQEKEKKEG